MPTKITCAAFEPGSDRIAERVSSDAFVGVCALVFAASTTATIVWCTSMSAMGEMRMAGGWTMSMAWTRAADQTWARAATSFLAMWTAMMVAMMLPSLAPMLVRYRRAAGRAGVARIDRLTTLVAVGYFAVWVMCGVVIFPLGVTLAAAALRSPAAARAVPVATGVVVLLAGALQFTTWKAHHLGAWRAAPDHAHRLPASGGTAWRLGLRLGRHCFSCCLGPTAVLLVLGVMDLRAMAMVTAAASVERLVPAGERVARGFGALAVGAGVLMIGRAVGM